MKCKKKVWDTNIRNDKKAAQWKQCTLNRNLGNVTGHTVQSELDMHFSNYRKYLSMHCEYDETAKNPRSATYWEADPCDVSTHGSMRTQFARAIHWALYVRSEGSPSSRTAAALQFLPTDLHPQSTSWCSCYNTHEYTHKLIITKLNPISHWCSTDTLQYYSWCNGFLHMGTVQHKDNCCQPLGMVVLYTRLVTGGLARRLLAPTSSWVSDLEGEATWQEIR